MVLVFMKTSAKSSVRRGRSSARADAAKSKVALSKYMRRPHLLPGLSRHESSAEQKQARRDFSAADPSRRTAPRHDILPGLARHTEPEPGRGAAAASVTTAHSDCNASDDASGLVVVDGQWLCHHAAIVPGHTMELHMEVPGHTTEMPIAGDASGATSAAPTPMGSSAAAAFDCRPRVRVAEDRLRAQEHNAPAAARSAPRAVSTSKRSRSYCCAGRREPT
eukprot:SAG31_NODE_4490_length_3190_cov_1.173730_2_plen_221_part_00